MAPYWNSPFVRGQVTLQQELTISLAPNLLPSMYNKLKSDIDKTAVSALFKGFLIKILLYLNIQDLRKTARKGYFSNSGLKVRLARPGRNSILERRIFLS
jgi:hypothetical protein